MSTHPTIFVRDWICSFIVSNSMDKGALFRMICWSLCSHRNNNVWQQQSVTKMLVVNLEGQMLLQWQQAQVSGIPLLVAN